MDLVRVEGRFTVRGEFERDLVRVDGRFTVRGEFET
jgi:hypothetical protein